MGRRLAALTCAVATLVVVLPAHGSAKPVSVYAVGFSLGATGAVRVTGSKGDDRVAVSTPAPNSWQVAARGGVIADPTDCSRPWPSDACGCANIDAHTAICTSPVQGYVITQLFGGADTVRADESVALWGLGGKGHDRLSGAERRDGLFGREGGDRLAGHGGHDRIDGGPGHDAILGGGGEDVMDAQNDDRDRVIDCGAGQDRVYVDPGQDQPAGNCEDVRPR